MRQRAITVGRAGTERIASVGIEKTTRPQSRVCSTEPQDEVVMGYSPRALNPIESSHYRVNITRSDEIPKQHRTTHRDGTYFYDRKTALDI
jgi:hypothetical protein